MTFKKPNIEQIIFTGAVWSVCLVAVVCLREFLSQQLFNLALGALTLPFALQVRPEKKGSYRFAVVALLFMALSFYAPVSTLVYFSLTATLLYAIENRFGRVNFLAIMTVILTMPLSTYLVNTFSFPIRLPLTAVCGSIFRVANIPVETAGNTFTFAGSDFTVDPACMGLNMLVSSFLIGILLIGFYQKKHKREFSVWRVISYLFIILILSIFSNLVRIMTLVLFRVFPDTLMHDVIGMFCFLVQVVLPSWLIIRGKPLSHPVLPKETDNSTVYAPDHSNRFPVWRKALIHAVCCGLLWIVALQVEEKKERSETAAITMDIQGYTVSPHPQGVVKMENEAVLVYIKQIRWFCDTEHNPMNCWSGSGYSLSRVRETTVHGIDMYTAVLQKDDDTLYTAWWYDNGLIATSAQLRWRKDMLFGAPAYSLLNVTTADEESLDIEAAKIAEMFAQKQGKVYGNLLSVY